MANKSCLAELAGDSATAVVDGERAKTLQPNYMTSDEIARDAGINRGSPRYSGLHNHCQYSRTC